jgi:hypothetical protein
VAVELAFETIELRTICESRRVGDRELGKARAEILRDRISDLRAAESVSDLLDFGYIELLPNALFSIRLDESYRIIAAVNHTSIPKQGANIDWTQVTRIRIVNIGGEHA